MSAMPELWTLSHVPVPSSPLTVILAGCIDHLILQLSASVLASRFELWTLVYVCTF